jgi:hypothetical protein
MPLHWYQLKAANHLALREEKSAAVLPSIGLIRPGAAPGGITSTPRTQDIKARRPARGHLIREANRPQTKAGCTKALAKLAYRQAEEPAPGNKSTK